MAPSSAINDATITDLGRPRKMGLIGVGMSNVARETMGTYLLDSITLSATAAGNRERRKASAHLIWGPPSGGS